MGKFRGARQGVSAGVSQGCWHDIVADTRLLLQVVKNKCLPANTGNAYTCWNTLSSCLHSATMGLMSSLASTMLLNLGE